MQKTQYELSVLVNGRPIKEYGHRGLTFVEGRKNQPYTIKFRNNSARRCLAVVSIDGIDVVDGKPATQESRGYIVPAYAAVEIKGWRTSTETVNDFVFTDKPEGYSTQTQGDDSNSGVIAVKVFDEILTLKEFTSILRTVEEHHHHHHHYPPTPSWPQNPIIWCSSTGDGIGAGSPVVGSLMSNSGEPTYSCSLGDQVKSSSVIPPETMKGSLELPKQENPDFNLGTGWGDPRQDRVDMVDFKRGMELCTMEVYYSDEAGLAKAGVEVDKKPAVQKPSLPKGFNGFCTPPKVTKTTV
jgi:hypothetical protein